MAEPLQPSHLQDGVLVSRLAGGDLDALGPLYQRYGGDVRSLLCRVEPTMRREDAEDLCQEVFLTFVDTLGRYEERGQMRSWLYGIAVRKGRSWHRRVWVRRILGQRHGPAVAGVALQSPRTEERIAARQRVETLLNTIPHSQREVLVLNIIEGLSARDTAKILGISENAVATRLHRARRTMEAVP